MDTKSQRKKRPFWMGGFALLDGFLNPYTGARWGDWLLHAALYPRRSDDDDEQHESADTEDSGQRHDSVGEGVRDCCPLPRMVEERWPLGL